MFSKISAQVVIGVKPIVVATSAGGVFTATMDVVVNGSPEQVFAIITDYEQLHTLDKRIKESRVIKRPMPHVTVVYTRTRTCMIICRSLERVERVVEIPYSSVEAIAIPDQSDLLEGRAHWKLSPEAGGTRISFETSFRPSFWVPGMIGRAALKRTLRSTALAIVEQVEPQPK